MNALVWHRVKQTSMLQIRRVGDENGTSSQQAYLILHARATANFLANNLEKSLFTKSAKVNLKFRGNMQIFAALGCS